jgi:hypothetical protein
MMDNNLRIVRLCFRMASELNVTLVRLDLPNTPLACLTLDQSGKLMEDVCLLVCFVDWAALAI